MSEPRSKPAEREPVLSTDDLGRTNILVRAFRDDRGRFPELFERVMPALHAWVELRARRAGGRIDSQDVLQEVWMRALQSFDAYDGRRSFRAWILGIAKNVLLQSYEQRREASVPARNTSTSSGTAAPDLACSQTSIVTRLVKDDSTRQFLEIVERLTPDERSLLLYCGIEGCTCAEAAQRLGITPDAATKRWQALRARLRENTSVEALAAILID